MVGRYTEMLPMPMPASPPDARMEQPVYFWTPDIAPGGISFYNGKLFPACFNV